MKQGAEKKQEQRSYILIEFPAKGVAEHNVQPVNVTQAQIQAAAFFLNVVAEIGIHEMLAQNRAQQIQDQAMMQSLVKSGKLTQ